MPFYNAKKSFSSFSAVKVLAIAKKVITSLSGNPAFTEPKPSLANLIDQATLLENAINQSASISSISLSIINAERKNTIAMLSEMADYVSITANGHKVSIHSAGFETTRYRGKIPLPGPLQHHQENNSYEPISLLMSWKLKIGI
jgi:hypothetical protein